MSQLTSNDFEGVDTVWSYATSWDIETQNMPGRLWTFSKASLIDGKLCSGVETYDYCNKENIFDLQMILKKVANDLSLDQGVKTDLTIKDIIDKYFYMDNSVDIKDSHNNGRMKKIFRTIEELEAAFNADQNVPDEMKPKKEITE